MYKILIKLYKRVKIMYRTKPERDKRYYFTNDYTFKDPLDNVHYFIMRDYNIGMHKQEFFEINIVIKGRGVHFIEDGALECEAGDVFIIPPEAEHGYEGGDGFDVYHIIVNNKFMQKNIADLEAIGGFSMLFNVEPLMRAKMNKPLHLKLTRAQFGMIADLLEDRKNQINFGSAENAFINTGAFFIIVTRLCEVYVENNRSTYVDSDVKDKAFMNALALIHERYNEKLSVDILAKEARLSKSTFMRRFIYICKLTPAEYITRKRIDAAESMLTNSNASVLEIAEKVGFYDSAHFSRTFKKIKGLTPSEYRKEKFAQDKTNGVS